MRHTLTFFIVLLLAPCDALQTADTPSKQNTDNPFMLTGNWLPEDPHQIDYEKLPRVTAEHVIISDVREYAGSRVHQHA